MIRVCGLRPPEPDEFSLEGDQYEKHIIKSPPSLLTSKSFNLNHPPDKNWNVNLNK